MTLKRSTPPPTEPIVRYVTEITEPDGTNPYGSADALGISCILGFLMVMCMCIIVFYFIGRAIH